MKLVFPRIGDRNVVIIFIIVIVVLLSTSWWAWHEFRTTPPYVDPQKYPISGIDVSSHNGMMNLNAVAASGIDFIFIKATEGKTFRDENFKINYKKARRAGLKIGAYHFFRFDVAGASQAHNLCEVIENMELDLGVVLDVEESGNPKNISEDKIKREVLQMAEYLKLRGLKISLYSNKDGYYKYFENSDLRNYPLWICSFSQNPINADWTFWQYNHRGKVKGIKTKVDLNVFNGTREEWDKYCEEMKSILK